MSTAILVKIILKRDFIELDRKIDLSFNITGLGVKYKIGTNFGGNIAKNFSEILQNLNENEVLFELTDDPMDINAEALFLGDGISLTVCGYEVDTSESLLSRMTRVQKFFEEILANENVSGASIDIDALNTFDYQEFDKLDIKVSDFANTMVELFKKEEQWTPTVRINFIK